MHLVSLSWWRYLPLTRSPHIYLFFKVMSTPNVGLKLTTPRSRVACFTDWASQVPHQSSVYPPCFSTLYWGRAIMVSSVQWVVRGGNVCHFCVRAFKSWCAALSCLPPCYCNLGGHELSHRRIFRSWERVGLEHYPTHIRICMSRIETFIVQSLWDLSLTLLTNPVLYPFTHLYPIFMALNQVEVLWTRLANFC